MLKEVIKAFKVEIEPTRYQRGLIYKNIGAARFAYNWALRTLQDHYQATGKFLSSIDLNNRLNSIKKEQFPWLYESSKCSPQEAIRDLDKALKFFLKHRKDSSSKRVGFPGFRKKKLGSGSFRIAQKVRIVNNRINIEKVGKVKLKERNYIPLNVKIYNVTVSIKNKRFYASVQCLVNIPELQSTGSPIGVDLGIKTLAVVSDGREFPNPKALRNNLQALKRLQRKASKKKVGSKNRNKANLRVAIKHEKVSNIRKDTIHKLTSSLVARTKPASERPSVIKIENLAVKNMLKNHKLAGAIQDCDFYEIRRQLEYKCNWYGIELQVIDRFFGSSITCSKCGLQNRELELKDREWKCECGAFHNRDLNAAINIRDFVPEVLREQVLTKVKTKAYGQNVKPRANKDTGNSGGSRNPNLNLDDQVLSD